MVGTEGLVTLDLFVNDAVAGRLKDNPLEGLTIIIGPADHPPDPQA